MYEWSEAGTAKANVKKHRDARDKLYAEIAGLRLKQKSSVVDDAGMVMETPRETTSNLPVPPTSVLPPVDGPGPSIASDSKQSESSVPGLKPDQKLLDAAETAYSAHDYRSAKELYSRVNWQRVSERQEYPINLDISNLEVPYWSHTIRPSLKKYYIALLFLEQGDEFYQVMTKIVPQSQEKDESPYIGELFFRPSLKILIEEFTGDENVEKDEYLTAWDAIKYLLQHYRGDHSAKGIAFKARLYTLKAMVEERLSDVWNRIAKQANRLAEIDWRPRAEANFLTERFKKVSEQSSNMVRHLNRKEFKAIPKMGSKATTASSLAMPQVVTSDTPASLADSAAVASPSLSVTGEEGGTSHQTPIDYGSVIREIEKETPSKLLRFFENCISQYKEKLDLLDSSQKSRADIFLDQIVGESFLTALEITLNKPDGLSASIGKALIAKYIDPSNQASINPINFISNIVLTARRTRPAEKAPVSVYGIFQEGPKKLKSMLQQQQEDLDRRLNHDGLG